ncbi:MAG: YhgE/Pip domain-containing protein [Microbacteriaceae bacterium]|nr:YhgE/Pip domain-containing protein [Microbacteriaceae bacterium]
MTQQPAEAIRAATKRSRAVRVAIAAIACIPLIYGGALIWANQDPTHRLDKIPAAVVDLDKPVALDGTTVDVGTQVARGLVADERDDDFDWKRTDAASAAAGLKDGTYLAVITLPRDLSANAASLGGDVPADASASKVTITTDDGHNYIVGVAAKTVGLAISQSASSSVTRQYLSGIYSGLDTVSTRLGDAADGAKQLASGASGLKTGTTQLASGASQAASGAATLSSGSAQLTTGAQSLASGAGQLADGAQRLSSGLSQLKAETDALPAASAQLASGAGTLSQKLSDYTGGVDQLAASCASIAANPLTAADPVGAQLCAGVEKVAGTATGSGYTNSAALDAGAQQLASGAQTLSSQAPALTDAVAQASAGAGTLAGKMSEAASGAEKLAGAAADASAGASALATGTSRVAQSATQLESGATTLVSGSQELASKLADGAASAPAYSASDKKHLSEVGAQPIALEQTKLDSVPSYGYGLAPYFMALGAWVGGLSIYMLLRAIPLRSIERGRPGWLAALLGYLRGAGISLAQAALLYLVVTLGIGVHPAHPVGLALFLGLVSLAFTAVNHALMVVFGSRGRFLGLILLVLQVAAAGATYPIQTAPGFFQVIHSALPLTYAANAFRSLIAGGGAGVGAGVVVLACWLLGALAVSVGVSALRAARKQPVAVPDFAI